MNYEFPVIYTIDDVLPHIEGCSDFIVADKGDHKVIDYVVAGRDTFGDPSTLEGAIRHECRGLVFDRDGVLLGRRYHKFFNINEKTETLVENIDFTAPHMVLDKVDGSMVSGHIIDDQLVWMTRLGRTDVAEQAHIVSNQSVRYYDAIAEGQALGITLIWEWCSPMNRVVIDWQTPRLILTGARCNVTGEYIDVTSLNSFVAKYNFNIVDRFGNIDRIEDWIKMMRIQQDIEGYVIRFENGHMVKAKTDWYVRLHKVISQVDAPHSRTALILQDSLDDLIPVIPLDMQKDVVEFRDKLLSCIDDKADRLLHAHHAWNMFNIDRKDFALQIAPQVTPLTKQFVFQHWNDTSVDFNSAREYVKQWILDRCNRPVKFQAVVDQILKEKCNVQS